MRKLGARKEEATGKEGKGKAKCASGVGESMLVRAREDEMLFLEKSERPWQKKKRATERSDVDVVGMKV